MEIINYIRIDRDCHYCLDRPLGSPFRTAGYVNITKKNVKYLDLINTKNMVIEVFPIFMGSLIYVRDDI